MTYSVPPGGTEDDVWGVELEVEAELRVGAALTETPLVSLASSSAILMVSARL